MNDTSTEPRIFTLGEANAMLPLVRAIVTDIQSLAQSVLQTRERLDAMRNRSGKSHHDEYGQEVEDIESKLSSDVKKLNEYISELRQLGVEAKGLTEGLVDFPAILNGEVINLCWKLGEPRIAYWHTLEGGFAGRQLIDERLFPADRSSSN